jgi:hypothetical protein
MMFPMIRCYHGGAPIPQIVFSFFAKVAMPAGLVSTLDKLLYCSLSASGPTLIFTSGWSMD